MKTSTHQREHETSRPWQPVGLWSPMLIGAAALALVASTASLSLAADLSPQEAQKIGVDAFIYGYSLITSDITEAAFTNVQAPSVETCAVEPVRQSAEVPSGGLSWCYGSER